MGKMSGVVDLVKTRMDSWYNAMTGVGTALRDKQTATRFLAGARLSDETLDLLYHENDVASIVVDALPEDALRQGFFLTAGDEDTSDVNAEIVKYQKKIQFLRNLKDCAVWGRLYGGATIYLGIDDGKDESEPVNMEAIKSINFSYVIDRRYIGPETWYSDATKQKFGQPEIYRVSYFPTTQNAENINTLVHESRLLRFDGARTSFTRGLQHNGWSDSVLTKVDEVLTQFGVSWQGVSHLMTDANQAVYKIKNLMEIMSGGGATSLQTRMELVEMSRSVARAIIVDADTEEFERANYSFAGLPDMLQMLFQRLATAAQMPLTRLAGQSPAGMNATGESDIRLWYDRVKTYQTDVMEEQIEKFWTLLFAAKDFEASKTPKDWSVGWGSLWQPTAKEQAEIEKITADKDKIYIDSGVLLPEEVTLSRFTSRGFSQETQVDLDARKEMMEAELKLAKEQAGEPPMPPPGMPGAPGAEPQQPPGEETPGEQEG